MSHIVCGTYHCRKILTIKPKNERMIALKPFRLPSQNIFDNCVLLGVDKERYFLNNQYDRLDLFSPSKFKGQIILVLTSREKHYLRVACGFTNIEILSLEKKLPFLKEIKYLNDARKNYFYLKRIFPKCRSLFGKPFSYYSSYFFNKVVRKLKEISSLDAQFAFTQAGAIQEVYALKEMRARRRILAYDFNSMFPSCIAETLFPDPARLKYKEFDCLYSSDTVLGYGVFHVILSEPKDEFIKQFHAIKYNYLTRSYLFKLAADDSIETLLHSNEIEFYAKHFNKLEIKAGIYSEQGIQHPLSKAIKKLYKRRLAASKNNNAELEAYIKQQLTICCSSVKVSKKNVYTTGRIDTLFKILKKSLYMDIPEGMPRSFYLHKLTCRGKFSFHNKGDRICFTYPRYIGEQQVSTLASYLFAEARVKMLKALEYILAFKPCTPEICYVNVDSIHVSIPEEYSEELKKYMQEGGLADSGEDLKNSTPQLGRLKLEAEAEQGIWLSPGRYWLIKEQKILKYVNALMNIKRIHAIAAPVKTFDVNKRIDEDLSCLSRKKVTIRGCLGFQKKLAATDDPLHQVFERYAYAEIKDYKCIDKAIEIERAQSQNTLLELYQELAESYGEEPEDSAQQG